MLAEPIHSARTFIYTQARLLDRYLFAALFEGGPTAPVKAALRAYQNADGGFGSALEPDVRTPASQPVALEHALILLDLIDDWDAELVQRACDWLESVSAPASGGGAGVALCLPGVEDYPHQPWMQADAPRAELNPTTSLCGLLLKHGVRHAWVDRAAQFCAQAIPASQSSEFHDLLPMLTFLEYTPDRALAAGQMARIRARVQQPGVVTLDPQAEGYVKFPYDWAPRPASPLRSLFSDEVYRQHLQALAARQQSDGGWPINWPALSPAAEAEWRGWVTIEALLTLQANAALLES